jgi:hypothetical protein
VVYSMSSQSLRGEWAQMSEIVVWYNQWSMTLTLHDK